MIFMVKKIGFLVGSLREEAYSKKVALAFAELFPDGYETELVEIGHLPLYNQDFDDVAGMLPKAYTPFREEIKGYDAFVLVTPEYNRSYPAALKNALDVGSRPYGANLWDGKPVAVISQSPGALGAFGANHHLRQVLVFLNMVPLQQPEAYIGNVHKLLNEDGSVKEEKTKGYFQSIVDAFVQLIESTEQPK